MLLVMKLTAILLLASALQVSANWLPPPNQTISGIVKDTNNNPVEGANVAIKKLSIGTTTNKQGRFELKNVPPGTYELEVSFVGFKAVQKTITVGNEPPAEITVTLQAAITGLSDVVVVGYGRKEKGM